MYSKTSWPSYGPSAGLPAGQTMVSPAMQGPAGGMPGAGYPQMMPGGYPGMMPGAGYPGMMPGAGYAGMMPNAGYPGMPTAVGGVQATMPPPAPSGAQITPGGAVIPGVAGAEESYVENILRMNLGKVATIYMTFENNCEWNAKIFKGVVEAAGRDHIIISDPTTRKRYLLLTVNLDYITFDEPLVYNLPFGQSVTGGVGGMGGMGGIGGMGGMGGMGGVGGMGGMGGMGGVGGMGGMGTGLTRES